MPATLAGADGLSNGFRLLYSNAYLVNYHNHHFVCTHFSPAATDGKDPNKSGCLGDGDSLWMYNEGTASLTLLSTNLK